MHWRLPANILTIAAFLALALGPLPLARSSDEFVLPKPGVMVHLSPPLEPPILKGIKVYPDNPFRFDFVLDKGGGMIADARLKDESTKLVKYFLASLTIPEKDLWVNLSPYEKDRIIQPSFGLTEMGRDLLAEDYILKQLTATLIYPEDAIGKEFWKHIYIQAQKRFGTTNVPVNTFNKVWIVPEKAVVYENARAAAAYVVDSKLRVMLEEDYLSMARHEGMRNLQIQKTNRLGSQIVREIVIPQLTREVNEGRNFAQLRQVYNSLILAAWYKKKIRYSLLQAVYADKAKTAGLGYKNSRSFNVEKIYQRYLQAFKTGVYNYIKEEQDPRTHQTIPRKYFSGGAEFGRIDHAMSIITNDRDLSLPAARGTLLASVVLNNVPGGSFDSYYYSSGGLRTFLQPAPDGGTQLFIEVPAEAAAKTAVRALISRIRGATKDFAMTSDGKGNQRFSFKFRERISEIKDYMEFVPWERYATMALAVGTIAFPAFVHHGLTERIITMLDTMLLALLVMVDLQERLDKRFMGDHNYFLKLLQRYYEKGEFSNGHSSKEVMRFYKINSRNLVSNLDDDELELTLKLLGGTLSPQQKEDLRKSIKGRFEQQLIWAVEAREKEERQFMTFYESVLNPASPDGKPNKPFSIANNALAFFDKDNKEFSYFLTSEQQEKIAATLSGMLSESQKKRILKAGPSQASRIRTLIYLALERQEVPETAAASEQVPKTDSAMTHPQAGALSNKKSDLGGIDLTAEKTPLEVQNAGEAIKFNLDPLMLNQLQYSPGFVPVIINIQPMTELRVFLGLSNASSV
jgi:hypothetical protein